MPLNNEQKKQYKSIGHDLKPVLIVAGNGLNEGVIAELERALVDHELIKVEIRSEDREERAETIAELCKAGRAEPGADHWQESPDLPQESTAEQAAVQHPPLQVTVAPVSGAANAP